MMLKIATLTLASALAAAGCASPVDVDKVPVGSDVELIRQDGGVVSGTLTERSADSVKVSAGSTSRAVPREEIAVVRIVDAANPTPLPPIARFREFTLPEGTKLAVRLESAVSSVTGHVEDPVEAILSEAVVIDGVEVLPAGSLVRGEVAAVQAAGKVKGRASLTLRFTSIAVAGRDDRTPIQARAEMLAPATKGEDAAKIGIPAAGGAIIGGILGGKKGAAIGTAIGGGSGAAVVLATAGEDVRLARGAALTLSLDRSTEVRVPTTTPPKVARD